MTEPLINPSLQSKTTPSVQPQTNLHCEEFFAAFKPSGLSSHETEKGLGDGFIEYLIETKQQPLWLTHRLDKGTSGVMLVSNSKHTTDQIGKLFEAKSIKKVYHFITDRGPTFNNPVVCSSLIQKQNGGSNRWSSHHFSSKQIETSNLEHSHAKPTLIFSEDGAPNSETQFRVIHTSGQLTLVEALPVTGKTHQIRLHARDLGIPILGDLEYGGTPFIRLCLHCSSLSFSFPKNPQPIFENNSLLSEAEECRDHNFTAPMPAFFERLELIHEPLLCKWYEAFHRRQMLFECQIKEASSAIRLLHTETDPLRVDKLGEVLWAGWWSPIEPTTKELKWIETFLRSLAVEKDRVPVSHPIKWQLQFRTNRESNKEESHLAWGNVTATEWVAEENSMKFLFKKDAGLSPGLFLDQRRNRQWVRLNSSDKKVLNLFSYTGGFSVAAVLGGATLAVSVDASKAYLDWSRENFSLNGIDPNKHQFWAFDTFEFLEMKIRKKETFDLIVCDPPSFGRSKKAIFKFEKDFGSLLENLKRVLSPNGRILFSSNFEKWDNEEFSDKLAKECRRVNLIIKCRMFGDYDFEMPRTHANLKAYLIEKKP